ncbi:MAG: hypothetical protein ACOH2F_09530 [Cellulomonas sp.]
MSEQNQIDSAVQTMDPQVPVGRTRRSLGQWVVAIVVAVLMAVIITNLAASRAPASTIVPESSAMENALGVRFSRVAVVADGGLITVSYVVLDAEKATRFQSDREHPPVLRSESRDRGTHRVSLMKQGHSLRAGQTYYLVYENTAGALRSGEQVTIDDGDLHLPHVPVL